MVDVNILMEFVFDEDVEEILDHINPFNPVIDCEVIPRVDLRIDVNGWRVLGDPTFKVHFRMNRSCFEKLVVAVGNYLETTPMRMYNLKTPLDLSIMMGLWPLCNGDTFRSTAVHFATTEGVVYYHYERLVSCLAALKYKYIAWPDERERDNIKVAFERRTRYPGAVGAIDGTHIYVTAPLRHPQRYVNRHHTYSILAQAVCDHNQLFRDVYVGEPGSVGDARMFSRSTLYENLYTRLDILRNDEHIVADSAYPLTTKTMIPYPQDTVIHVEREHNRCLSSLRSIVERSFALLKQKFPRLRYFRSRKLVTGLNHIMSCFVLHNFILLGGNALREDEMVHVHQAVDDADVLASRLQGAVKREYIAHMLAAAAH